MGAYHGEDGFRTFSRMPMRPQRELRVYRTKRQAERDTPYPDTHTIALFRARLDLVEVAIIEGRG